MVQDRCTASIKADYEVVCTLSNIYVANDIR